MSRVREECNLGLRFEAQVFHRLRSFSLYLTASFSLHIERFGLFGVPHS